MFGAALDGLKINGIVLQIMVGAQNKTESLFGT